MSLQEALTVVTFSCSQCDKKLRVADGKGGTKVKCPGCGTTVVVPADAEASATKPASAKAGAAEAGSKTRPDGRGREKGEKKSSQTGLWLGVGGGGAALCVLVLAFVMFRGDKEKPAAAAGVTPAKAPVATQPEKEETAAPVQAPLLTAVARVNPKDEQKKLEQEALKLLEAPKAKPTAPDIYQHVLKSTALVIIVGNNDLAVGGASGTLVDRKNRLLLTNYHVVANAAKFVVIFPMYRGRNLVVSREDYAEEYKKKNEKDVLWGKVLGYEQHKDLALIQLDKLPPTLRAIPIAAGSVQAGEGVHSVGNPGSSGALFNYTPGTVRAVYRNKLTTIGPNLTLEVDANVVETNSAVNPGDSGGPLVNDKGELVGITAGGLRQAQLQSYFIDISEVVPLIEKTCKAKNIAWVRDGQPLRATAKIDIADLIKYLEHPNPRVRTKAVEMLGERGAQAQLAIKALVKTLNDKDEVIPRMALEALKNIGAPDKADLAVLRTSLQDRNDLVRTYAAGALGKLGVEARTAVPELVKALEDPLPTVRQNAAESLSRVGSRAKETVVPALTKLLKDDEKEVRVAAADAVYQLMSPMTAADLPQVSDAFLKHNDLEIRTVGARALGQLNSEPGKSLPLLIALCKSGTDKTLRLAALGSIANFGAAAKPAVDVLIEAVKDNDPEVRQAASVALGKIGPDAKAAVLALEVALKETDPVVRGSVIVTLGEIGPEAGHTVRELGKLLSKEKDREIRIRLVTTLGKIGTASKVVAPEMVQAFSDAKLDQELKDASQGQSIQIQIMPGQSPMQPGGQAPPPSIKVDLQGHFNQILGKVDKGFQEKNVEALSKVGRGAVAALTSGLLNPSPLVRWGCLKALGEIGPAAKNQNTLTYVAYLATRAEPIGPIKEEATNTLQKINAKR
jgi:HEAT repeat protein/S1-C subfamily serine protease/phage FluMu protein Com